MITLLILFLVIQSQITGGFTYVESNKIQFADNNSEKNVLSTLLKVSHKIICAYLNDGKIPKKEKSCCISIMGKCLLPKPINENDKRTEYEAIITEKSDELDSSRRSASATKKHSIESFTASSMQANEQLGSQQDIPSQSTEPSELLGIEAGKKMLDNNDDGRKRIVRDNILFIILGSILLVTLGIVCIVGGHWFTYDKLVRRDRRRRRARDAAAAVRSPTVVTVSSSYRRLGLADRRARRDCPDCAVRPDDRYPCTYDEAVNAAPTATKTTTTATSTKTIKTSPPPPPPQPFDDPPPPSYDECASLVHATRRTSDLQPADDGTTYWYTSV